jgi:outer membrane protein insertion porin family/translocation and assembly module TamA
MRTRLARKPEPVTSVAVRASVLVCLAMLLAVVAVARAAQVDELDPAHDWKLRRLRFEGNVAIGTTTLEETIVTRPRRWFALWQSLPAFDPITFRSDLERLQALYRSYGYYHAVITHDVELPAEGDDVVAVVYVDEGPPVLVQAVSVDITGAHIPDESYEKVMNNFPLEAGDVFEEAEYDRARALLRTAWRDQGYARVDVVKKARVDVRDNTASVHYTVDSGEPAVFHDTKINGLTTVEPEIVEREVAWTKGEEFREKKLDETRKRLESLRLFRTVRLGEDDSRNRDVDIDINLVEAPKHEIRFGVGYSTEDGPRGLAAWRDYNFYGGARQLGFTARISQLRRSIAADFLQPHFPSKTSRFRLVFAQEQYDEDTYTLNQTRGSPRLEWDVVPGLAVYGFYRAELDLLSGVRTPVRRRLPAAAPDTSILSGFGFGVDWNATDDLLDPTRGWILSGSVEPVGGVLGGDVDLYRVLTEGRFYRPLLLGVLGAMRLRIGSAEPTDGEKVIPLFERFYAGGINSVRGYARRRVGPLASDEPIGGNSLVETSFELRRAVTEQIGAAVFVDAGQVSLQSWDFPFGDMQYGTGFGLRYRSPVGPIRVDLGFPLDRRGDDAAWQVYLSVGQTF